MDSDLQAFLLQEIKKRDARINQLEKELTDMTDTWIATNDKVNDLLNERDNGR